MIQAQSVIEKVTTLSDGTLRLVVDCQEMQPAKEAEIFQLRRKLGWFCFSEAVLKEEDIPTEEIDFKDQKTLDEQLNAVLFAYHMEKTKDSKSFHTFKRDLYETLINRYKEKLNEIKSI